MAAADVGAEMSLQEAWYNLSVIIAKVFTVFTVLVIGFVLLLTAVKIIKWMWYL